MGDYRGDVIAESRGRVSRPSGAAAKLRIPPSTLDNGIRALKINKRRFKFGWSRARINGIDPFRNYRVWSFIKGATFARRKRNPSQGTTSCRMWSSNVLMPVRAQNCFGLSSPVSFRVRERRRLPSPPAMITPQRRQRSSAWVQWEPVRLWLSDIDQCL